MKRKKYIIPIIIVLSIVVIVVINNISENVSEKRRKYRAINERYMEYLYIQGDCQYKIQTVDVENKRITNENQLYVDVVYYNLKNEEGNKTSVEELLSEYENFCNNDGNWDNLESFYNFDYGNFTGAYHSFCSNITTYLMVEFDTTIYEASKEQLNEGIDYAVEEIDREVMK